MSTGLRNIRFLVPSSLSPYPYSVSNQTAEAPRGRGFIVAGLLMSMSLAALDSTVVATAIPTIVGNLGGLDLFSWVFSVYLLTSTVTVPLFGKLADLYGRKPILAFGLVLFIVASSLCGFSQSMEQLIFFRALQGIGAGAVLPMVLTIIGDLFPIAERAKIQGLTSSVWGVSGIAGPVVGAFFTDQVNWRWVFFINIPFGIAAITMIWWYFHENVRRREHSIDFFGMALLSGGVVSLLLALLQGVDSFGWTGPETLGLFATSVVLLGIFIWQEKRSPEPLIPLDIFRIRLVAVGCLAGFAMGGISIGVSSYVPLFIQGVYGGSATDAGLLLGPMSVSWPIASVISGKLIPALGYRPMALVGGAFLVAGAATLLFLSRDTSMFVALFAVLLVGAGMGFATSATIISVQNAVDWSQRGVATAMTQFVRTIGGSIMVAVMGAILASRLRPRLDGIEGVPAGTEADDLLTDATREGVPAEVLRQMQEALASSLQETYILIGVASVLALSVFFLFPKGKVEDLKAGAGEATAEPEAAARLT
jgi:EmrB/QacA subfamily drug resistance transporter